MDRSPDSMLPIGGELPQQERDATCPEHGAYRSRNIIGRIWSQCPGCAEARRLAETAEEEAAQRQRIEARHRAMLDASRIPARFIGRTFENFRAETDAQRHALAITRDFAENFAAYAKKGASLILSGQPGTGKSHLSAAVLQKIITRNVRYLTCMDLIRAVRETWRRDSEKSETEVLRYFETLDLLVIDEVGMQYGTDGEQNIIFDVIDRRYREVKPLILITNQNREGFDKFVGDRVVDRLREVARWVPFDWASHRPQARKDAA